LVPSSQRKPIAGAKRRGRVLAFNIESGGRWALIRRAAQSEGMDEQERAAASEQVARILLQRYGVVFWRLLAREAGWLPPWRDLLRIYRRLEARGEIRGGRFVAGFSGEQYALPEAVGLLRETRRRPPSDQWISLSGADPLNLIGILTPGPRLPALTDNRLIYRDGLPVATLSAGKVDFLTTLDGTSRWEAEKRLMRSAARGLLSHLS
jgi:ATP-dependent Lhr-like helicase